MPSQLLPKPDLGGQSARWTQCSDRATFAAFLGQVDLGGELMGDAESHKKWKAGKAVEVEWAEDSSGSARYGMAMFLLRPLRQESFNREGRGVRKRWNSHHIC
jgi:hypothetical protein